MGTINNQLVKFHDGFTIEQGDVTFGNRTVVQAFGYHNGATNVRTWSLDFFDPSTGTKVRRRDYKLFRNMLKAVKAHCAEYFIEWDELEHVNNLHMITVENPYMAGEPEQISSMYEGTAIHDLVTTYLPGKSVHVGKGMWLTRCGYCPVAVAHLGTMPYGASMGKHMETAHASILAGKAN